MGSAMSAAREEAEKEDKKAAKELNEIMNLLENKRQDFLNRIVALRGKAGLSTTEVAGGRTLMRQSEIRAKTGGGVDDNIAGALCDFIDTAQGGQGAKASAIEGGKKAIRAGLDALFGASAGCGMEKQGFWITFMNNAFVRVDFFVYTFCSSGKSWGAQKSRSGACYVADLAVLDTATLEASEIDYLLTQALMAPPSKDDGGASAMNSLEVILKMKIMLCESAVLSRLLKQENIDFKMIREIAEELAITQRSIKSNYDGMVDYKKPLIKANYKADPNGSDSDTPVAVGAAAAAAAAPAPKKK